MPDFIEVYDRVVPSRMCKKIIDYFENNKDLQFRGRYVNHGELLRSPEIKDSTDMTLDLLDEIDPSVILRRTIQFYTDQYIHKYRSTFLISSFSAERKYNIQRYKPGQGYHVWHYEDGGYENGDRCLVYSIYLNDIEDAGETEFLYLKKRIKPEENKIIIWPAGFTHTHRGNVVHGNQSKYIITGWFYYV